MAELKTKVNDESVTAFLNKIEDEERRKHCFIILEWMKDITKEEPKMWGTSIVGFGQYHYKYDSGREGDFFITGFSPRKQNMSIYIMTGFDKYDDLMSKLGKHKTGKSCLYVKSLDDINHKILKELITLSYTIMDKKYNH